VNDIHDQQTALSASWAFNGGENRTAHLNGRVAYGDFRLDQRNHVTPTGGVERDDRLAQDYDRWTYEIGGDVTRPFAGGGLKILGLYSRRERENLDVSYNRIAERTVGGYEQYLDDTRDEAIGRLTWSRGNIGGWSIETGVEGAFTRLDSRVDLYLLDTNGLRERVDLPVDQAVVSEYRGEAFVNAGRPLSSNLRVDMGLTYEASRLTVRGDADAERSLSFLKPKVAFDWRPGHNWHLQFSAARTVAQLDFEDFISSAELSNDRVNGGNADLLPQRAWELLASIERPILGDGRVQLELGYNIISLLQDRVPTPEGFDAPGNLGTGRQAFVAGVLDVPLTSLGISGGRLTLRGRLQDTSVRDPYTHLKRRFSGYAAWELGAEFRQDLGRFAWGADYSSGPAVTYYRRDETDMNNSIEPYISAFVEYRPTTRTTLQLSVRNLFTVPGERTRTFYRPDRSNLTPSMIEYRSRNQHATLILNLKHSFN
jgi:outer membrane receptor protein involved in Fe transport